MPFGRATVSGFHIGRSSANQAPNTESQPIHPIQHLLGSALRSLGTVACAPQIKSMRFLVASLIAASLAAAFIGNAHAEILIIIDKSAQRMTVERDGEPLYTWPVSTGRTGYAT